VTANVLTPSGPELRKQTVIFDVDQPLQVGQSVVSLGGYSKAAESTWTAVGSTTVRISNLALGSGSSTFRAKVRSGNRTLIASIPISWDATTGTINSSAPASAAIGVSVANTKGKLTIRITNGLDSNIEIQAFDKTYLVVPDSNNFTYSVTGKSGQRTTVTVFVDGNLALVSSQQVK
jgi:hypothetical protein